MSFIFGKKKTPQEVLREHQRALNRAIREMDRERQKLQNQEKKLTMEIKKLAQQGQMGAAKIMAKDLVRTRNYVQKFYKMRAELQAVSMRIVTLKSTAAMGDAMRGATRAMMVMNRQMNLPQMQRILMEFERQSDIMDSKEEMMSDTMDDIMGDENEEEDTENVVNQVLEEIGVDMSQSLADAPMGAPGGRVKAAAPAKRAPAAAAAASTGPAGGGGGDIGGGDDDDDLEARLGRLKK